MTAQQVLDQFYLEARSRTLDLAATLDRLDRGAGVETIASDPRLTRLQKALELLLRSGTGRAEAVQKVFSLDYDAAWPRPTPR